MHGPFPLGRRRLRRGSGPARGDAPAPIVSRHFPDRVHEFVWRNWNAVEPAKLAKILGTSVENVTAMAESMGLPPAAAIPPEMKTRGYITLIRRNWHLLPYDQLLELVEMTPERLAFALREDDFLWVKLGQLKPKCEPLRYHAPDEAARRRAAEIRRVVEEDFGEELRRPAEPRFDFVRQLSSPLAVLLAARAGQTISPFPLRFVYSYLAVYGDPLLNPQLDPYPDGFLRAALGRGGQRRLAARGAARPGAGRRGVPRVRRRPRAASGQSAGLGRAGQEVRHRRVSLHERAAGDARRRSSRTAPRWPASGKSEFTALCTSHPAVRQWMGDALAHVFRQVPDLGGVYAITASENLTNCASHGDWQSCEHCKARSDADIIAEVVAVIEEGVHRGNPKANVIVSDWGWRGHGDAPDIIARLPKSVWLMSVSEWDLPIERGGIKTKVGEYSISAVGPGPRALRHWAAAAQAGTEDGGRDPVQQHVRNRQHALSARHGPGGRAHPQPGPAQAGRHADRLDDGRASFAQLPAGPAN